MTRTTTAPFLQALRGQNGGTPPVWLMRQAGRYLPAYRRLRERYTFLELCKTPELVAAVTTMPIDVLGVDAAILFADILLLAEPLGFSLRFDDGTGPSLSPTLQSAADVDGLPNDPAAVNAAFDYMKAAIAELKCTLQVPLVGFAAAPFTLATYLIEGGTGRDFKRTKQWLFSDPDSFHRLLQRLTDYTVAYLQLQIRAGVDAIQLFDSWAHVLAPEHFAACSARYLAAIRRALPKDIPVIFFCRGTGAYLNEIAAAAPNAVSADWTTEIRQLRAGLPAGIALQGNLDPAWLYAPPVELAAAARSLLSQMAGDPAYVFSLGHGVLPDVSVDAVRLLVDTVKSGATAAVI